MVEHVRVAIAHDYLTQRGGAERVVLSLRRAFPEAPIFTTLYNPDTTFPEFRDARIVTSFLNKIPAFRADHRRALPLLPLAAETLKIDADVVVASSTGFAHGFPTTGRRVVYCHSPARFLYLSDEYLGDEGRRSPKALALAALKPALIAWDQRAARRADRYLANSSVIRERIRSVYGIDAEIVFPPAGVSAEGVQERPAELADWADGFYLVVSRLMPYKNVEQAIEAFRGLEQRLVVVGSGPLEAQLRAGLPANVRLLQRLPDAELRWLYAHCAALIAPSHEDFGLTPLEASAHGKPTLALHAGGYLDTVVPDVNGSYFEMPKSASIKLAIEVNEPRTWDAEAVRRSTERFAEDRFIARLRQTVDALLPPEGHAE